MRGELVGDDRDAPVAEPDEVLGGGASAALVVDAHAGHALRDNVRRIVDEHGRQPAVADRLDHLVALGHAVDDEAVDRRGPHRPGVVAARDRAGHEQEPEARLLGGPGDALEEEHRRGVREGVGEPVRVEDADGPGPPAPQAPRRRVRPRVTEPPRRLHYPPAYLLGELIRPVVRVRHRRRRHPDLRRHLLQGGPPSPVSISSLDAHLTPMIPFLKRFSKTIKKDGVAW